MPEKPAHFFTASARALASPRILFWALPWLMLLLFAGTVAERYIGLYQSQKLFFGSFILWLGPVPLPGAYATLGLIAASLTAKLLMKSPADKANSGTWLTHVSVLILLAGGLISAYAREEGYMILGPGETSSTVMDYNARALVVEKNGTPVLALPEEKLRAGVLLPASTLPFSLHVLRYCYPCVLHARTRPDPSFRGAGIASDIAVAASGKEDDNHRAGLTLEVRDAGGAADGSYLVFEGAGTPETMVLGKDRYAFMLGPEERSLPFAVKLVHFEKAEYPGTDRAKSYRSDVEVEDAGNSKPVTIGMNEPLRLHGYTLYQSSYLANGGTLYTVLAVVKNVGAPFPYIAILLLCAGLALHLALTFRGKRKGTRT